MEKDIHFDWNHFQSNAYKIDDDNVHSSFIKKILCSSPVQIDFKSNAIFAHHYNALLKSNPLIKCRRVILILVGFALHFYEFTCVKLMKGVNYWIVVLLLYS